MINLPSMTTSLAPVLVPSGLGALAVYWLLPRARPNPVIWGASAAGLAILAAGWYLLRTQVFTAETLLFYAFAAIAVLAGGLLVTQRNPARAALSFALVILSTCGLFLLQAAPFLMAATIIIYAGAIVVTFLFVIMLAQQEGPSDADQRSREPLLATIAGFVLLGAVLYMIRLSYGTSEIDEFADNMDGAVRRLEDLQQRNGKEGAKPSTSEIEAALQEVVELIGDGLQIEGRHAKALRPLDSTWLADLELKDDEPGPAIKSFRDNVTNAWAGLSHCRGALAAGSRTDLDHYLPDLVKELHKANERMQAIRREAPHQSSFVQPSVATRARETGGEAPVLSEFSGPAADRPVNELRHDGFGRPQMPAENVAGLGRSLFTDYLLAIELAGTLLLVATIGAIAISLRRHEKGA